MLKFSIVIPIYNTEQYLAECVESILRQDTSASWELILVDNGSQDNAGAMCEEYAARDARIKVIHQENRRPGGGRNAGLRIAQGEYVLFVDSDDWWEPQLLSEINQLITTELDLIYFGYYRKEEGKDAEIVLQTDIPPLPGETGKQWLERQFAAETAPGHVPWGYAYRREFLQTNQIEFREDIAGPEDFDFNMRVFPLAQSVVGYDGPLYNYRIRYGSAMTSYSYNTFLDVEKTYAQAFRRNPTYGMANYYAACVLLLTLFSPAESKEAVKRIRNNLDILKHVSCRRKLLLPLMHIFGIYRGAKLYKYLQVVKKKVSGSK